MKSKQDVMKKAKELGATFEMCRTKTVYFTDLARGKAKFIYFDKIEWKEGNKFDELKKVAKENGFILG